MVTIDHMHTEPPALSRPRPVPFRTGYTLALPRAARPDLDLELEPTGQGRAASKGTKLAGLVDSRFSAKGY